MPFNPAALLTSPGLPGVGGRDYPATYAAAAKEWADAVHAWAAAVVPPSTSVAAGAAALEASLLSAFSSGAAADTLETAFGAFALTLAGGMVGYVAVPPPGPVGFAALFDMPAPATREEGAQRIADALGAWAVTGTATLVAPPYTPLTWL